MMKKLGIRCRMFLLILILFAVFAIGLVLWTNLIMGGDENMISSGSYKSANNHDYFDADRSKGKIENDIEEKLNRVKNIDLPQEYDNCKEGLSIYKCILETKIVSQGDQVETEKISVNKDNYKERFKEVLKFKTELYSVGENVDNLLSTQYYKIFRKEPKTIFENYATEDDEEIKKIIFSGKVKLVDDLFSRNMIRNVSTCNKIQIKSLREYCISNLY